MDGPTEYHTKQSNSERQLPYDGTYMWNLKYDVNEPICEIETDSQTEQTCGCGGRGGGEGVDWEFAIRRCKLVYRMDTTIRPYCVVQGTIIFSISWINPSGKEYV